MTTQRKNKKEELIPDINKVKEIKTAGKRISKKEDIDEPSRTGPKTSRQEEKDPREYPMKG